MYKYLISFLLGFLLGILIIPKNKHSSPLIIDNSDTIIDSFYIIQDSFIEKIKYLNIEYEKDSAIIMSNDDSINLELFSKYIYDYNNK